MTQIIVNGTEDKRVVTVLIVSQEPMTELTLTQAVNKWLNTLEASNDPGTARGDINLHSGGNDPDSDNYCGAV